MKPSSSKDPFALRRAALGIIRLIVENNKEFKNQRPSKLLLLLYQDQGFKFESKIVLKELTEFLLERLKYYMKEKNIRADIINSGLASFGVDSLNKIFRKSSTINKIINIDLGQDVISSYKRTSNILDSETKSQEIELSKQLIQVSSKASMRKPL